MKKLILFYLITFTVKVVFANGGVVVNSSIKGAGDPVFKDITDIYLISEKLEIKLNGEYSDITVTYVLWNKAQKDYNNLDYGFPVDYQKLDVNRGSRWKDSYIKSIAFIVESDTLSYYSSPEKAINSNELDIYRKWFYTQFSIKSSSLFTLKVHYSIRNQNYEEGFSPYAYDTFPLSYRLQYDFSPASHWGDGIIRDFFVTIDFSNILLSGTKQELDYYGANGLVFTENNGIYTYQTRNFDLKKATPLTLVYSLLTPSSIDILKQGRLPNDAYIVTTSGAKKGYDASNLIDMNLETAWVSNPKNTTDTWIEVTLKKPQHITRVALLNGYYKNKDTYTQNNRIKKLKIESLIVAPYDESVPENKWLSDSITLEDVPYQQVLFENLFNNEVIYYDYTEITEHQVLKIRITILEVYNGSKYDDTCISELFLLK